MFNIDFTFLWTLVNLLVLFLFLKKFLFGRVGEFLEKRAAGISAEREAAAKDRDEAKRLQLQFEEKMAKAEDEAAAILRKAREDAETVRGAILAEAKAEAENVITNGRARTVAERQAALLLFRAEAAALIVQASGKLLQRNLDSEDNRSFAASLLAAEKRPGG
ncbi:MAG: F0F1 ATP synthase subunit B [Spirochaetaceae bacterium]|jgi:F-type H+-transporting ATPase subunit b|nr:F0F1 ATP synthase subunit B [Spirochaetaceae bacterium]